MILAIPIIQTKPNPMINLFKKLFGVTDKPEVKQVAKIPYDDVVGLGWRRAIEVDQWDTYVKGDFYLRLFQNGDATIQSGGGLLAPICAEGTVLRKEDLQALMNKAWVELEK